MKRTRTLFFLTLALGALAVPASASAADGLFLESGHATLVDAVEYPANLDGSKSDFGSLEGEAVLIEKDSGPQRVVCGTANFDGPTFWSALDEFGLNPELSECSTAASGGTSVSVDTNSCEYGYSDLAWVDRDTFDASSGLECAGSDVIELTLPSCTITIPEQPLSASTGLVNGDSAGERVIATPLSASEVEYTTKGLGCLLAGWSESSALETQHDGRLQLDVLLDGDVFMTQPTLVEAEDYPADLVGERLEYEGLVGDIVPLEKSNGINRIVCDDAAFDGGSVSGPVGGLDLAAELTECDLGGGSGVTVDMNGCRYAYWNLVGTTAVDFEASAAIECDEGQAIEATLAGCQWTIPEQVLNAPAELQNDASTGEKVVLMGTTGTGVEYTTKGLSCLFAGWSNTSALEVHEDGIVRLHALMRGDA